MKPAMNENTRGLRAVTPEHIGRFGEIVGPGHVLTDPGQQEHYLREWRDRYVGRAAAVLRPGSTEEVSRILTVADEARIGVVPQGGNTGLVGGQIPDESGDQIVLSVERLRRIRVIDDAGTYMIVEAGLTLAEARAAAEEAGRLFPLSLASEGSCQIGGVLATNAGGAGVLAYGSARQLALGLEVVLAGGAIWNGLRTLRKDNTGYDIKDLFIGSEGTLGVITAAALKLVPRPAERVTALVALHEADALLALFRLAETRAGAGLTMFEFFSERALGFVLAHVPGVRAPFAEPYPWLALLEISGTESDGGVESRMERLLAAAAEERIIANAVIARSLAQAQSLWRLREAISEAQKPEGGSIKHDVAVPVPRICEFMARAAGMVESLCPGARPVVFGHFGDGNVHYNVSQPPGMDMGRFLGLWEPMARAVHALVTELGGSISAEHGIGRMKRDDLKRVKGEVELDLMRRLKAALDPNGILNPGKLL